MRVLYRDARDASPEGTADVTDQKLWEWFVSVGKFSKMFPSKTQGKTERVRRPLNGWIGGLLLGWRKPQTRALAISKDRGTG